MAPWILFYLIFVIPLTSPVKTAANVTDSLAKGVLLKPFLLLPIIKMILSGLIPPPHVVAVLTVLSFDVTSWFEAAAEPCGL